MSRIIKSAKVSLGNELELDNVPVIKIEEVKCNRNVDETENNIKESVQKQEVKTQEEIEELYMEEARKKSELFFDTEMQRAYDEGMEKAKVEAHMLIESAKQTADNIVLEATEIKNNIASDYKNVMESMEKDIIDLVLEVSKKVIAKEMEKPDYIINIISEAIDKCASKKDTILKISEEDYDFVVKNKEMILLNVEGFGEIEIIKEASLNPGSCIVENKFGIIDGSIKTRMSQIEKEVERILNR